MIRIAVIGSTSGTDLGFLIENQNKINGTIELVISNKEDAYILQRAKAAGFKTVHLPPKESRTEFDAQLTSVLEENQIDLVLLIGYMRFLSESFVNKWKNKVMNVHPSLLPKYAGGMDKSVHEVVLDNKEKETGMTIHFVDEGADTGPIILQKKCNIEEGDTVESLKNKVQKLEGEGFIEAINLFADNKLEVKDNKVMIKE